MANTPWQRFKATKSKYCKQNASYKQVRAACKKFVDAEVRKAKPGTKTATRKKAYARAKVVLKKNCTL